TTQQPIWHSRNSGIWENVYLNVLVKDSGGLSRYFHVDHAEISLTSRTPNVQPSPTVKSPPSSPSSYRLSSPKPRKGKPTRFDQK
ncbi:9252_t:CDS:2, partial [Paraglomus brasilianum]